jgi:hypothetical protein
LCLLRSPEYFKAIQVWIEDGAQAHGTFWKRNSGVGLGQLNDGIRERANYRAIGIVFESTALVFLLQAFIFLFLVAMTFIIDRSTTAMSRR